jgi:hypothetical protein
MDIMGILSISESYLIAFQYLLNIRKLSGTM